MYGKGSRFWDVIAWTFRDDSEAAHAYLKCLSKSNKKEFREIVAALEER